MDFIDSKKSDPPFWLVFSINWSQMFALYVRCVVNSNWKLWTTEKQQHRFGITRNVTCIPIHAFALHSNTLFFSREVLHKIWRIFPQSFDIVVASNVPTRYLIFCTKQMRKQSLFYWMPSFSWLHGVSLFGNIKRCVVVSFSGLMYIHESDVEHALCFFQEFIENIFKFSADLGAWNESTVKSGIFPRRRSETCFFYT